MATDAPLVFLLRGVNVGGRRALPMARLRDVVAGCGFDDVRTYIQSGNVVCRDPAGVGPEAGAAAVADALAVELGAPVAVIGRSAAAIGAIVDANPYPEASDRPTTLHVALASGPGWAAWARAVGGEAGGADRLTVTRDAIYLHLPNGLGRSRLGERITRGSPADGVVTTVRNWRTVVTLARMAAGAA